MSAYERFSLLDFLEMKVKESENVLPITYTPPTLGSDMTLKLVEWVFLVQGFLFGRGGDGEGLGRGMVSHPPPFRG